MPSTYGGIGAAVIGHEMIHGYDDQGQPVRRPGQLQEPVDGRGQEEVQGAHRAPGQKQFDDYVAIDGLHVKGQLTLGENIADLGGLNVASTTRCRWR